MIALKIKKGQSLKEAIKLAKQVKSQVGHEDFILDVTMNKKCNLKKKRQK